MKSLHSRMRTAPQSLLELPQKHPEPNLHTRRGTTLSGLLRPPVPPPCATAFNSSASSMGLSHGEMGSEKGAVAQGSRGHVRNALQLPPGVFGGSMRGDQPTWKSPAPCEHHAGDTMCGVQATAPAELQPRGCPILDSQPSDFRTHSYDRLTPKDPFLNS